MPYTKQQWHDDTTTAPYGPINGTRLNYIETGIETAQSTAEAAGGGGGAGIGTALPLMDGAASAGSGTVSSAVDHVHPTDTSRAPLASPTFTGHPVGVTETALNNSTRLATTAYTDTAVGVETTRATTAEGLLAPLASPTFTGTPSLPTGTTGTTQSAADSTTKLATTAFVTTADNLKANLASPTFTGTPVLPTGTTGTTQSASDNSTKLATTAYADTGLALKANLASPTFTGSPVLPTGTTGTTQSAADNSTKVATTAYVDAKERAFMFGKAGAIGATETNAADFPFIVPFAATMKRCKAVVATPASGAMTVQIRKASAPGTAVPSYADVTGFVATFANGSQIATFTLGTAVTVAEGDLLNFSAATGSGSNLLVQVVAT